MGKFLTIGFVFFSLVASAQEGQVVIEGGRPVGNILEELASRYHLRFAYDSRLLDTLMLDHTVRATTPQAAVEKILEGSGMTFRYIDSSYVILPRPRHARTSKMITGTVRDGSSGEALPWATLLLEGTMIGTTTHADGHFSLELPAGTGDTITLTVSYLGYAPRRLRLSHPVNNIQVTLSRQEMMLEDVAVEKEDAPLETGPLTGEYRLNPAKLLSLPNMGEVDIFSLMQLMPGITASNEAVTGISLRGSTADQNLLLFDGYPLYKQDHCFGLFSSVNPHVIRDIRIYKSAYDARYGGKVGGIIDITGRSGNYNNFSAHAGINTISGNAMVEVPLFRQKGSLLLAGRRSFTDVLTSPLYRDIFNSFFSGENMMILNIGESQRIYSKEMIPSFHFYDMNVKFSLRPDEKDLVSVSFSTGKDKLVVNDPAFDYRNDNQWGNDGLSIHWSRQWNAQHHTMLTGALSSYYDLSTETYIFYDTLNGEVTTQYDAMINDNRIREGVVTLTHTWQPGNRHRLESGLSFNHSSINYLNEIKDSMVISDIVQQASRLTGYIQYRFQPFAFFHLLGGIRSTWDPHSGRIYAEPRLTVTIPVTEHLRIKGAAGLYHQYMLRTVVPGLYGDYSSFWVLADGGDIPVMRSHHFVAGIHYEAQGMEVDAECFSRNTTGLSRFYYTYDSLYEGNGFFTRGKGKIYGIDVLIKKEMRHFTGWIGYTYSINQERFDMLNDAEFFPANNDQRHQLKIAALFRTGRWNYSFTWRYATGLPYTSPPSPQGVYPFFPALDDLNNDHLPDHHRLDMSVTYRFPLFRKKVRCVTGLSVINLYNRHNLRNRLFFTSLDEATGIPYSIPVDVRFPGFTPSLFLTFDL